MAYNAKVEIVFKDLDEVRDALIEAGKFVRAVTRELGVAHAAEVIPAIRQFKKEAAKNARR